MSIVKEDELTRTKVNIKPPKMYCCAIYNDDITTMDFVVMALCEVFGKTSYEAAKIMTYIHNHGKAKVGLFCYDIAMTKKIAMDDLAEAHCFPLRTTVEEADA